MEKSPINRRPIALPVLGLSFCRGCVLVIFLISRPPQSPLLRPRRTKAPRGGQIRRGPRQRLRGAIESPPALKPWRSPQIGAGETASRSTRTDIGGDRTVRE